MKNAKDSYVRAFRGLSRLSWPFAAFVLQMPGDDTMMINVRLIKPLKRQVITYQAEVLSRSATHMLVLAEWTRPLLDLGYVTFAPGDRFYEHFYSDRWYNVYEMRRSDGALKGWYCNVTRPTMFHDGLIESEDLELDVFVSPDRRTFLLLDEDEYAARDLERLEPLAHHAAMAALDELRALVEAGAGPFVVSTAGTEGLEKAHVKP